MVNVKLAGFNVDRDSLSEIEQNIVEDLSYNVQAKEHLNDSLNNLKNMLDNVILNGDFGNLDTKISIADAKKMQKIVADCSSYDLQTKEYFDKSFNNSLKVVRSLTPETIAAAYARISRDPREIPVLRKIAREDIIESRKTNKAVIFTMGHKSIGEHAYFNFDVLGLSRKAVETVQKLRLGSFTEKSQRYITLDGDYVIPNEIRNTPEEKLFVELIEKQIKYYNYNLEKLQKWHGTQDYSELFKSSKISDDIKKQKGTIEGLGKEDARYPLAMATEAQLGISVSARNLEKLITELRSSDLDELKELGEKMFNEVDGIAPSVIKYTKPTLYFQNTRKELKEYVGGLMNRHHPSFDAYASELGNVHLFENLSRDDSILAGILFSSSKNNYTDCLEILKTMQDYEKTKLFSLSEKYQEVHDPKLRELELGDRVTEFNLSSSAFAQLKRHRMNTLITQDYNISLGATIPISISSVGLEAEFIELIKDSSRTYLHLIEKGYCSDVADYALTNAHRRRVLFDANNRQVHAICAERKNLPAQWDIRQLIDDYSELIQKSCPITLRALPGKDKFYDIKKIYHND